MVLPVWKKAASVLLYTPLPGEVDVLSLLEFYPQKRFFFPKTIQRGQSARSTDLVPVHEVRNAGTDPFCELELYEWTPEASWVVGPYGLREPDPQLWKQVAPQEVDLALIPGLAFDQQGGRLGRGGGFYDRLLSFSSWKAFKIGVAWPWQLVECIPRELHDVLMDIVITVVE